MASIDETASVGTVSSGDYSISTDHVFNVPLNRAELPRDAVRPPDGPEDDAKRKSGEPPTVDRPVDSRIIVDSQGARMAELGHPAFLEPEKKPRHWLRRILVFSAIAAIVGAAVYWGVPEVRWMLSTASTDDAFVAGHTTYASPRVEGLLTEVLVEQNDRVEPGTVLARLDREPYEIALRQSEASLVEARANLELSRAQVRAQIAGARGSFFRRKNQQEQLRRQIKSLEAQVATLKANQSSQKLAAVDQKRVENLTQRGSASQSELDQRNNTLDVANQRVQEAWTMIQETRAGLGLEPNFDDPLAVPRDLAEKQSGIESALSDISSSLAQIGIPFDAHNLKPGEGFEQILRLDSSRGLEDAFGKVIEQAPAVRVALATVNRAERDLENARLRLSWTEIRSEIAGTVQDRSSHPGNRVEPGQTIVSIRPDYVWVDANFKETQLHQIQIGMPVDLYVDAYPKRVFRGRVAGFNPGTGLSESLLPPENATGNYIKVTQRLPVRIELTEPNPAETPLFIGLSVVPYVKFKEQATGPDAGLRLHPSDYRQHPDSGSGPAGSQSRGKVEARSREAGHL